MSALSIVRTSPADFLKVEEISGDDRIQEEMAQITKLWKWAAKERIDSASNEEEAAVFNASKIVNSTAWQRTQRRKANFRRSFSVVIAYDCEFTIRAFAFIKKVALPIIKPDGRIKERNCIQLKFLSSDPTNLCKPSRFRGAGSAILQYLFEKCIQESCYGIFVEPLEHSARFYGNRAFAPFVYAAFDGAEKNALLWKPKRL